MPYCIQRNKDIIGMEEDNLKGYRAAPSGQPKNFHSYFTKKLERKLREKEIEIPQSLYLLMDTPFDDFSEADREIYENQFRALTHVFVEALRETYISMGNPYQGWEELSERLQPTPMKVLSGLVLGEEERLQVMADEAIARVEGDTARTRSPLQKDGAGEAEDMKDHWWDRKIF